MKKLVYIGILCSSFPTSTLFAQCGQANNIIQNISANSAIALVNSTDQVGQSFIATCSGNIEAITVKNSVSVNAGDIMLTLYDGVNPNNPLDSVIVTISSQNAANDLLITLATPVFLTSGNAYTFMLRNMTGSSGYNANDLGLYAGGGVKIHLFGSSVFENGYDYLDLYFEIHYQDNMAPVAVCQDITVELDQTGNVAFSPSIVGSGSSDDSGVFTLSLDTTYTCNDIGTNLVILSVIDPAGNSASCNAIITVVDLLAPEITCPSNQDTTMMVGENYFLPDYLSSGIVSIMDNCTSPILNTIQNPVAGTQLAPGVNLVSITAEDEYGNQGTCNFEINVGYLSLDEMDLSGIEIYPNPSSNYIQIEGLTQKESFGIYNVLGAKISNGVIVNDDKIDLQNFINGIYFLKFDNGSTLKFVKK